MLTIWHRILNADSTKTPSSSVAFCRLGYIILFLRFQFFFHRILHACHGVLFKQLSAWMLHGILLDEYNEFFIAMKNTDDLTENRRR